MEIAIPQKIIVITYNVDTYLMPKDKAESSDKLSDGKVDKLYNKITDEIAKNGYIWFPWKNRAETFPQSEKGKLASDKDDRYEIYLLNKGAKKQLYHINASDFVIDDDSRDVSFDGRNGETVIEEFKDTTSQMWMRIVSIEKVSEPSDFLKNYSFFHDINPGDSTRFPNLYNKRVFGRSFLINSEYCIFFLRFDPDSKHPDVMLKPRQAKYAKVFTTIEGNSILMLSDLHCPFPKPHDKMGLSYMQKLLLGAKRKQPAALIVSGDFSDKNGSEGYDDAIKFISKLCVQNDIKNEATVFAPGNHDIGFCDNQEFNYSSDESKIQYINFYRELLSCDPRQSLCRGSKLILKNGLPIEVLALNSVPYTQNFNQRGFGLLAESHLNDTAEKMGWKENEKTYSYRILVFHHPLFPVGDRNNFKTDEYKQEVIINPKTVHEFIRKYGIDLIITGHAHTEGHLRFIREGDLGGECVWLGLGSCSGEQDSVKSIYCLDFDEYGKVKFYGTDYNSNFEWNAPPIITFDINISQKK